MTEMFQFRKEHSTNWGRSKEEWEASMSAYKNKYFAVKGSKRDFIKDLGKNMVNLRDDTRNDYYNSDYKQRSRMLKSKGLGWESYSWHDLSNFTSHLLSKTWEELFELTLEEWDDDEWDDPVSTRIDETDDNVVDARSG
jgi:hypothetical protein